MHSLFTGLRWLIIPLALLLWLQWPLREVVQAYSREANDAGQVLFALYGAVAVSFATWRGAHLRAGRQAQLGAQAGAHRKGYGAVATAACVVPWALFSLWTFGASVWQSVAGAERFPETNNFGYFMIKVALLLLCGLVVVVAIQGALRELKANRSTGRQP